MKVSDILRVKGNTLFTVTPNQPLAEAVAVMAEHVAAARMATAAAGRIAMLLGSICAMSALRRRVYSAFGI